MLWQAGGDVATIGDAASVAAFDYVKNLVVVDKSAPKSVLQSGQSDVGDQFGSKQCAMMFNGPWVLPSAKKGGFTFATAPWPARARGTYGPNYSRISQAVSAMEQQVLAQGKDPQQAANEAAQTIKPLLSKWTCPGSDLVVRGGANGSCRTCSCCRPCSSSGRCWRTRWWSTSSRRSSS